MDNSIEDFNFFIGYESQNVFIYFLVIPLLWCMAIDYKWIRKPVTTITYLIIFSVSVIAAGGWPSFANALFKAGVSFCAYWNEFGYSYAEACIVWCILWPMTITIALLLIPRRIIAVVR